MHENPVRVVGCPGRNDDRFAVAQPGVAEGGVASIEPRQQGVLTERREAVLEVQIERGACLVVVAAVNLIAVHEGLRRDLAAGSRGLLPTRKRMPCGGGVAAVVLPEPDGKERGAYIRLAVTAVEGLRAHKPAAA